MMAAQFIAVSPLNEPEYKQFKTFPPAFVVTREMPPWNPLPAVVIISTLDSQFSTVPPFNVFAMVAIYWYPVVIDPVTRKLRMVPLTLPNNPQMSAVGTLL